MRLRPNAIEVCALVFAGGAGVCAYILLSGHCPINPLYVAALLIGFRGMFAASIAGMLELRHNRRNDRPLNLIHIDIVQFQNRFESDCIFQFRFRSICRQPLHKIYLFVIDTPNDDITVSHINCKYHFFFLSSYNFRGKSPS